MMQMGSTATAWLRMQKFSGRLARTIVAALLSLIWTIPANADSKMTEAEYLLLPEYCKAQGNVSERYYQKYFRAERTRQWQSGFGGNYQHYHHYCWSIVAIARAYKASTSATARESMSKGAIHDIEYVLERSSPDFILLPEIYTKLGEAYLLARDDRNAEAAFRKAWEIKPSYWRPYVWWAQRLIQLGKMHEALAVAEEGQKNAPNVKALDDLIRDLRAPGKASKK